MKKVTLNTILNVLADDDTMKWTLDGDGGIRTVERKNKPSYCPLTAYIKLVHNLDVDLPDASQFCRSYINMDVMLAESIIDVVDDDEDFGEIIDNAEDVLDKDNNREVRYKQKLRQRFLVATGLAV